MSLDPDYAQQIGLEAAQVVQMILQHGGKVLPMELATKLAQGMNEFVALLKGYNTR